MERVWPGSPLGGRVFTLVIEMATNRNLINYLVEERRLGTERDKDYVLIITP